MLFPTSPSSETKQNFVVMSMSLFSPHRIWITYYVYSLCVHAAPIEIFIVSQTHTEDMNFSQTHTYTYTEDTSNFYCSHAHTQKTQIIPMEVDGSYAVFCGWAGWQGEDGDEYIFLENWALKGTQA